MEWAPHPQMTHLGKCVDELQGLPGIRVVWAAKHFCATPQKSPNQRQNERTSPCASIMCCNKLSAIQAACWMPVPGIGCSDGGICFNSNSTQAGFCCRAWCLRAAEPQLSAPFRMLACLHVIPQLAPCSQPSRPWCMNFTWPSSPRGARVQFTYMGGSPSKQSRAPGALLLTS